MSNFNPFELLANINPKADVEAATKSLSKSEFNRKRKDSETELSLELEEIDRNRSTPERSPIRGNSRDGIATLQWRDTPDTSIYDDETETVDLTEEQVDEIHERETEAEFKSDFIAMFSDDDDYISEEDDWAASATYTQQFYGDNE